MAIILNDNIDTRASKPTDNRFGPYISTAAALAGIPEYQRYVGLTVGVGTPIVEYWFDSSLTLVLKTTSGTVTGITAGTGIVIGGTAEAPIVSVTTPTQLTTNISTDVIADQLSDTKYPSVKATKTYVDANVAGLLDDRGNFAASASPGNYPQPPKGSGPAGAVRKGDLWFISVPGYLNTTEVGIGASVRALVDDAGALADADWDILDTGLGFIPENVTNKVSSGSSITSAPNSATLYPSLKALTEYLSTVIPTTPTLQQVTDAGYVTTNPLIVGLLGGVYSGFDNSQFVISDGINSTGYFIDRIIISSDVLIFPTSIPSNLATIPISVNGNTADSSGAITIPVVTGTGTTNYVSKWSSSSALTDSQIFDNGTYVGIGTNTPAYTLDIQGSANFKLTGNPDITPLTNKFSIRTGMLRLGWNIDPIYGRRYLQFTNENDTVEYFSFTSDTSGNPAFSMNSSTQFSINSGGVANNGRGVPLLTVKTGGNVGIGTTSPDASSLLDMNSTTQGFLPPRMTQAERLAIVSPAEGLIVYDTTNSALGVYSGGGWRKLSMEAF